jgi:hypothetical protein
MLNHLIKHALLSTTGDSRYGYIAPYRNQAKNVAWDFLKKYTGPVPGRVVNESDLFVEFTNGSRIRLFGADNADVMRGLYFDGVVMDEVADMEPGVWGEVVRPALSDRVGWACFIGTPRGMNMFHDLYVMSLDTPGWAGIMFKASETGIIKPEELEDARRTMTENQFRQEFMCDFSASMDDVLISIDLVTKASKKALLRDDLSGAVKVIGVDVARYGGDRSVICKREGLWAHTLVKINHIDNMTFASKIAHEIDMFHPDAVFIDAGRGEGVIDRLRQMGYPCVEVNFGGKAMKNGRYANKRTEMWDGVKIWLESGGALPDDADLRVELTAPTYAFDSSGRMVLESKEKIRERGMRSPDLADALALTFAAPVNPPDTDLAEYLNRIDEKEHGLYSWNGESSMEGLYDYGKEIVLR